MLKTQRLSLAFSGWKIHHVGFARFTLKCYKFCQNFFHLTIIITRSVIKVAIIERRFSKKIKNELKLLKFHAISHSLSVSYFFLDHFSKTIGVQSIENYIINILNECLRFFKIFSLDNMANFDISNSVPIKPIRFLII